MPPHIDPVTARAVGTCLINTGNGLIDLGLLRGQMQDLQGMEVVWRGFETSYDEWKRDQGSRYRRFDVHRAVLAVARIYLEVFEKVLALRQHQDTWAFSLGRMCHLVKESVVNNQSTGFGVVEELNNLAEDMDQMIQADLRRLPRRVMAQSPVAEEVDDVLDQMEPLARQRWKPTLRQRLRKGWYKLKQDIRWAARI